MQKPIVLASSSSYRAELLHRLQLNFTQLSPDIDESRIPGESPEEIALRLSIAKAQTVAKMVKERSCWVIGSDQVACLGNQILNKPGSFENAKQQLLMCSGKKVSFFTGLCLLDSKTNEYLADNVEFSVFFRELSEQDVEAYLAIDKPYDCAGSFKFESLGITLFERTAGDDPTSIIGLPLIKLATFFKEKSII